jgi:NAD(P)H-flavin reductase
MSLASLQATLQSKKTIAKDVVELKFRISENLDFNFVPGQFLMIDVPLESGKFVKRAYSLASIPANLPEFELLVKLLPDGKASNYFREMTPNQSAKFSGALGHFQLKENPQTTAINFVGTGTGLAPLKAMIEQALVDKFPSVMRLFFGVRSEEDVFCAEHMKKLAAENSNFEFYLCLSQPTSFAYSDFFHGRVTTLISQKQFQSDEIFFLCGSLPMVKEVSEILKNSGIPDHSVKKEIY